MSTGSAMRQNEAYMGGLEAKTKALQTQYEKLILSAPFEKLMSAVLQTGTALLKFANSDVGQTIIKLSLMTAGTMGVVKAFTALSVLIKGTELGAFIGLMKDVIATEGVATAVTQGLSLAMSACPLFWGALAVAGIALVVTAIGNFNETVEEGMDKLNELNSTISSSKNDVKTMSEQLTSLEDKKKEINEKKLSITDPQELEELDKQQQALDEQTRTLEYQLAIAKEKLKTAQEEAEQQLKKTKETKQKDISGIGDDGRVEYKTFKTDDDGSASMKALEYQISNYQKLKDTLSSLQEQYTDLQQAEGDHKDELADLQDQIDDTSSTLTDYSSKMEDNLDLAVQLIDSNDEEKDKAQELLDVWSEITGQTEDAASGVDNLTDSEDENADSADKDASSTDALADSINALTAPLADAEANFSVLQTACSEFNDNGTLSAETISQLAQLTDDWSSLLEVHNGVMSISESGLQALSDKTKEQAISTLQAQASQDLQNLALGKLNELSPIAQRAIEGVTSTTQASTTAHNNNTAAVLKETQALNQLAIAFNPFKNDFAGFNQDKMNDFKQKSRAIMDSYNEIINDMRSWDLKIKPPKDEEPTKPRGSSKSSKAKKAKEEAKKEVDTWKEAYDKEHEELKHKLDMDEISQYEYYNKLQELNEKYFGEASGKHEKYIKEYNKNQEEIYKGLKSIYSKVKSYLQDAVEDSYEKAIKAIEKEEKQVLDGIKAQIDALKAEKDKVLKGIQNEIDALNKQKDQVEKYWNDQIDAIKRENESLEEQNSLLEYQQQLQQAKAQKVMVYQNGKFQLGENEDAVANAEQNLANYEDQLSYEQQIQQMEDLRDAQLETIEERIEALEEYHDYMEEYYDNQIEAMEEYYDSVQEQYEMQIDALQQELDAFKEGRQKEEDLENARLAAQVLGMNERSLLYEQELSNLKDYINQVNAMLAKLGDAGAEVKFEYKPVTGYHEGITSVASVDTEIQSRASGDSSFKDDGIALVGESPNAELVLGSKLNNSVNSGKLMRLSKGSGVVNAESTQTLAGLLNGLATPQSNGSPNRTTQQNFNFANLELPNVTDADSFVNTLSNKFNNYAIQYGNSRH